MDHLDIPEEYKHKIPKIVRWGVTPRYDDQGFDGFLNRVGTTEEELLQPRTNVEEKRLVESNLIEWLFFGVLHEFELATGVPIDSKLLTRPYEDTEIGPCRNLSTHFLKSYVRDAAIERLWAEGVPLHIQEGDVVTFRGVHPTYIAKTSLPRLEDKYKDLLGPLAITDLRMKAIKVDDDFGCTLAVMATGEVLPKNFTATMLVLEENRPRPQNTPPRVSATNMGFLRILLEKVLTFKYGPRHERDLGIRAGLLHALTTSRQLLRRIVWNSKSTIQNSLVYCLAALDEAIWNVVAMCGAEFNKNSASCWLMALNTMKTNGWCAARISRSPQNRDAISFITELLVNRDQKDHSQCNILQCAKGPRREDYGQHDFKCASNTGQPTGTWACPLFEVAEAILLEIWQRGGIPGIQRLYKTETTAQNYQIVDVKDRVFVAISHVWSHGLGNPDANSLPMCQIDRMFAYIDQLGCTTDPCLWLDSLVVPISKGDTKLRTMTRLREIYHDAEKVLVLDRALLQVGSHWLEQRLQLGYSEWLTRLWTLQEGRSAKALYVQFSSGAVPLSELINLSPSPDDIPSECITHLVNDSGTPLQIVFNLPGFGDYSFAKQFMFLLDEMSRRKVTEPEDEAICLANLLSLKLNTYPLTMKEVYVAAPQIPQDIIFSSSPRLKQKGFRWAPSTFIGQGGIGSVNPGVATLRSDGLIITKNVIMLPERFDLVVCKNHFSQSFYSIDCGSEGTFAFRLVYLPLLDDEIPMCVYRSAVILKGFNAGYESSCTGVLVANYEKSSEVHKCRFGIQVWAWTGAEARARYDHGRGSQYTGPEVALKGQYLQNQTICVD